jgi:hypothetical protein
VLRTGTARRGGLSSDEIVFAKTYKLVHYSHGRWTAVSLPPVRNRAGRLQRTFVNDLARVPGSSQFWVTIDYNPSKYTVVEHIYRYQP